MLGVYNYTVILTYAGMLISFSGISVAVQGQYRAALICLLLSGVCDMFDGKVASTCPRTPQEKRFGVQIDSLSDLICFGILPAVIVSSVDGQQPLVVGISAFYVLSALIRLAWFNVDEEERQAHSAQPRTEYRGLPVTTVALLLPLLVGLGRFLWWPLAGLEPVLLCVLAVAFLTPFRLKKPTASGRIVLLVVDAAALWMLIAGVKP